MIHRFKLRVYYEDTDLAGIVYYANYLKFIERARSEWVRDMGVDQAAMKAENDLVFAVRRVEADYLLPAKFDDELEVRTGVISLGAARLELSQDIWCGDAHIFASKVTLICLTGTGRPTRFPAEIRQIT